jgi:hypothetical protein
MPRVLGSRPAAASVRHVSSFEDPQAVRNPRPDANSYLTSGLGPDGTESGGSRIFQWGFAPVGGARANADGLTPNNLALGITLGTVTVSTT